MHKQDYKSQKKWCRQTKLSTSGNCEQFQMHILFLPACQDLLQWAISVCTVKLMYVLRWGETRKKSLQEHAQKPKLSMTEHCHQMDGWLLWIRLCAHPEISPKSNLLLTPHTKNPADERLSTEVPLVYFNFYAYKRSHIYMHVEDPCQSGELWKHENSLACT